MAKSFKDGAVNISLQLPILYEMFHNFKWNVSKFGNERNSIDKEKGK